MSDHTAGRASCWALTIGLALWSAVARFFNPELSTPT